MQFSEFTPELTQMAKHLVMYIVLAPIFAFAAMYLVDFVLKSWKSGSRFKQWFSLTIVIFVMYIIMLGL